PIADAIAAAQKAVADFEANQPSSPDLPAALVVLGQLHEGQGTAAGLKDAVGRYDSALGWYENQPETISSDSLDKGEWARTWMNRGNALQKFEDPEAWKESVASYGAAIQLLEQCPDDEETRLTAGAAWMNLGVVLQKQGGAEGLQG